MPEQQPATSPDQAPEQPQQRARLIAAALGVTAAVAAGAVAVAAPVAGAVALAALTRLLVRWRYRRQTIAHAIRLFTLIVTPSGAPPEHEPGPAELASIRSERTFAAWFIERSTRRVQDGYEAGMADGEPEAREQRFIDQHLDAQRRRREAAARVDTEAAKPGQVTDGPDEDGMGRGRVILKWWAHPDDKVTPECLAAAGCWFYADTPPIIGYPGMPHGGTCRCKAVNAGSLAEVARGRHVNEAVRGMLGADHRPHPGHVLPAAAASA